ncbi:MAG: hypothetical protein EBS86_09345 [Crocinitomicaceae bacterium]|nr:hypothetical protein [Crocinitomicaceae bacterium]
MVFIQMLPKSLHKINSNGRLYSYDTFKQSLDVDDDDYNGDDENNENTEKEINESIHRFSQIHDYEYDNIPPVNSNTTEYYYPAIDKLNHNTDELDDSGIFFICEYSINSDGLLPFLQFDLIRTVTRELSFLCFPYKNKECTSLMSLSNFKGFIRERENKNVYLFFETDNNKPANKKKERVLAEEIINKQSVFDYAINAIVYDFFVNKYNEFLFLTDARGKLYEPPCVVYYGDEKNGGDFAAAFGVSPSSRDALVGPYYYFTDYENAVKNSRRHPSKQSVHKYSKRISDDSGVYYDKGRVLRFALFLGNTKIVMNHPDDPTDESETKKQLLNEAAQDLKMMMSENQNQQNQQNQQKRGNYNQLKQTMRVSDHDGHWTNEYDSLFVNDYLILDDGKELNEGPYWVVKEYKQQLFLNLL